MNKDHYRSASVGGRSNKDNITLKVSENAALMQFLIEKLTQKSRDNIKSLLRNRQVTIDGLVTTKFDHPLLPGQQVVINSNRASDTNLRGKVHIIYEDEHIIVIDKEAGVLSISGGRENYETAYSLLSDHVKQQNPANKVFVIHRLDRDTSGLMMFAKSEKAQSLIQKAWHSDVDERIYIAVVEGKVEQKEISMRSYLFESSAFIVHSSNNPDKGELAITHFKLLRSNRNYSMLEVHLETGKKNQIRVHAKELGHCVIGDKKYGATGSPIRRLGLHASTLAFIHPISKEHLRFESKAPARFYSLFPLKG